jgi:hypothetical protein
MPDDGAGKTGWKIFAALSAVLAAMLARKAVTFAWTTATGKEPPTNPEDPEVTWAEAAGWAVISGVVIALARLLAQRQAARTWTKASGARPPGLREVS